ncbi:MAG: hypothetical protein KIT25_01560 [Enhydrobacter sp.]|nr:MAG: hypothetical protein KIT25_01560 [Enhydrobacter sp.]
MSEKMDALLAYMADAGEQARHHETERSSFTNAGLGFAGAIATVAASAGQGGTPLLVGGIAVVFLGVFGLVLSLKCYERNRFHVKVFELARKAIDTALAGGTPPPSLTEIRAAAELEHRAQFRTLYSAPRSSSSGASKARPSWLVGLRLNRLWLIAWILVISGGTVLTVAGAAIWCGDTRTG